MISLFWSGFLLSLSLCLDIGVVNVAILQTGLARGFRPALWIGIGSCFGDLAYASLSLAGITIWIDRPWVRRFLWLAGTAVLLWFAASAFRSALRPKAWTAAAEAPAGTAPECQSTRSAGPFVTGLMLALSSPSALIWFATVGGSMIAAEERGPSLLAAGFFLAGFLSAGLVWSVFAAALSHQARRYGGRTMLRWLNALSGALFLYFAVRVFLTGPNGDTVGAGPHSP